MLYDSTTKHLGKGKTVDVIKRLLVTRSLKGKRNEEVEHRELLGQ